MRKRIAVVATLLGTIACGVWAWETKRAEAISAFLLALAALAGTDYWERRTYRKPDGRVVADRKLLADLVGTLPYKPAIHFARTHDLGASFARVNLQPLHRFLEQWNDVHHEFRNPDVELSRQQLLRAVAVFLADISLNTWPVGADFQGMPADEVEGPSKQRREYWRSIADRLNKEGCDVADAYDALVRTARERLGT